MPFILAYKYPEQATWTNLNDPVYETGAEASSIAKDNNARAKNWGDGCRYRVIPIAPEDPLAWRLRVNARFADGTYKVTPWDHVHGHSRFLEHIDPNDPTKVRFFANEQDGQRDKATTMTPGRFYTRYIDSYPDSGVVERYCAEMGLDMEVSKLQIAMDADGIEFVYNNGPHSCMAYVWSEDKFDSPHHPVRQYAAGDLGVAYITRGGDITARCMVWPEKKWFGRIYGDADRLKLRLKEEGYTEDWNFVGAKLLLERHQDCIIAPYVDGDIDGRIVDNHIELVPEGHATIILKGAEGLVSADSCQRCGNIDVPLRWDDDDEIYSCC